MNKLFSIALSLALSMGAAAAFAQQADGSKVLTNNNQSTAIGGQFGGSGYGVGGAVTSSESSSDELAETAMQALENACKDGKPVAPFNGTLMYVCKDGDLDVESPTCKPVMIDVSCLGIEELDTEEKRAAIVARQYKN